MEQKRNPETTAAPVKKRSGYILMNMLLLIILPALSVIGEIRLEQESLGWPLIGKWFIFWAIGIRLFTAGISQASNPGFTARIFNLKTQEGFIVIRELGFANISLGAMGILSVLNNDWRLMAAFAGGLFFGLAGIQHAFRKPATRNEVIAMFYDLAVLVVVLQYLFFTLIINNH